MADIVRATARYRRRLADHVTDVSADIVNVYGRSLAKLEWDLRRLRVDLARQERAGKSLSAASLARERRYQHLILDVKKELLDNARYVASTLDSRQQTVIDNALDDAARIVADVTDSPDRRLRHATVLQVIAATDTGPLRELLEDRAGDKAEEVRQAIVDSILRGQTPATTARRMRQAYGGALTNALTIARTETARAQREAARLTWLGDPAVTGWWWQCQCTPKSCAFCWGQHGTEHALNEVMGTHPNCLCVMLPLTADVDYGDIGPVLFDALTEAEQAQVLSPSKLTAYQAGEITLRDLVGTRRHPKWGPVGFELSLTAVLGAAHAASFDPRKRAS